MALTYELHGQKVNVGESVSMDQPRILHVTETVVGFHGTRVSHWYYDIDSWLVSSHGKEGDKPDRPMDQGGIDWVRKYYLPKVGLTA